MLNIKIQEVPLVVQWLRLCFQLKDAGMIPGRETKIQHAWAAQPKKKINIERLPFRDACASTPSMIRLPSQARAALSH